MIILITGASHTGKTALAQRLLEKYKYPYLSIDHLKMGLIRSGYTKLTPEDDNELTDYLWPIIREMIKTAIENKQNLIIEGVYIPFDWEKDFEKEYLDNIRYYCLVMSENYIKKHFCNIKKYASAIEKRLDDDWCTMESILEDNAQFLTLAKKHNANIVFIDDRYEIDIDLCIVNSKFNSSRILEDSEMEIRKYQPSDCKEITELFYNTVHTVNAKDYTKEQLDVWATGQVDLEKWNLSLQEHYSVVAVENDIIVGFGDIDKTGYLNRLFVNADYQGQGIATAICDQLEQFVEGSITTHASITARPFFEKRGYKVIKEQQVERQEIFLTNYVMVKERQLPIV